jgi:uncharacterized protein YyaL (SSP411 family)
MTDGDRLLHSFRDGRARHTGLLDDYANMGQAALELHEQTGEAHYLERCRAWLAVVDGHFRDPAQGGYFYTADDAEALITRTRHAHDNAVPPGNGALVHVFHRLYHATGDETHRARADAIVTAFAPDLARNVFPFTTLLNGVDTLMQDCAIVIVGDRADAATRRMAETVHGCSLPGRALLIVDPGDDLPAPHPAAGKGQTDGQATVYVCRGNTCSLPLTDPAALADSLRN